MTGMKRDLQLYIIGVTLVATVAIAVALALSPPTLTTHNAILAVLLVGLVGLTYLAPVTLASKRQVILNAALHTVAILTLSPGEAALLMVTGAVVGNVVVLRRPWFNTIFNGAQVGIGVLAAASLYRALSPVSLAEPHRTLVSVVAVLPAGLTMYVITALAVDCAAAIQHRRSPFANWLTIHGPSFAPHAVLIGTGAALATAVNQSPILLLVAVAPVTAMRAVMQTAMRFDADTVRLAEEIADALDAREAASAGRSRRVAELARALATACQLPEAEVERVAVAARLYGVGMALVPDQVMPETSVWSDDQRLRVLEDAEARTGFVIRTLRLSGVADILRFQRTRYDGQGFPYGLSGKSIPLGSRIVALCHAWVGLTSDRGYRGAMDAQQALVVLRAGAGTQWDPELVDVLIALMHRPVPRMDLTAAWPSRAPLPVAG